MGKFLAAILVFFSTTTFAVAQSPEPFGAPYYSQPDFWAYRVEKKLEGEDKKVIDEIALQVRQKPEATWIAWTNQLVKLSKLPDLPNEGACARLAVAKFEVLLQLGFSKENLRLVYGRTSKEEHAVVAVHTGAGWLILDSRKAGYRALPEAQVADFKAERSFN